MLNRWLVMAAAALGVQAFTLCAVGAQPARTLDFQYFVKRVEPIFLQKRPGHTRCYVCHAESNNAFRLERLAPGSRSWTEEQSRKNFAAVSLLANPADPATSRLLMHPLAPESGGGLYHSGGRQFASKNDPAFKTLAQWIIGATLGGR